LVENRQRRGALHHLARLITITGMGDHGRPESVITFHRIERSSSTGIRDHVRPEHAGQVDKAGKPLRRTPRSGCGHPGLRL